jgi:hypothetical protein
MAEKQFIAQAILHFNPEASVNLTGEAYADIYWSENDTPIGEATLMAKAEELQASYYSAQYQRDRAAEYPPMADYLDGIVKGDQAQIDAYIAACQAVKSKYPKPE